MWFRCIRSCTKDPSHKFLVNGWLVHNCFVSLGSPLEFVMHHLIIGGMTSPSYQDKFLMISVLVCIVTHWTRPIVNHDLRLSSRHDFTKLLHYVVERQLSSGFDLQVRSQSYPPYGLGHCWWKSIAIGIFNSGTMISHRIETKYPLKWS